MYVFSIFEHHKKQHLKYCKAVV